MHSENVEVIANYGIITEAEVVQTNVTVEILYNKGYLNLWNHSDSLSVFKVQNFHFHSPSEHTVDGLHYDLELHIVHQDS